MPDDVITNVFKSMFPELKRHLDMTTLRHWSKKIANTKNILNKSGQKYYSQNDEDGILLEILNRMNKKKGSFHKGIYLYFIKSSLERHKAIIGREKMNAEIKADVRLPISFKIFQINIAITTCAA